MSKNYELDGIANTTEIGEDGVKIKTVAGQLQVRNNTDTGLVKLAIADGTADSDAVTKSQLDAVPTASILKVTQAVNYNDSSPVNIGSALPANAVVIKALVYVTTAFDDAAATLEVGVSGDTDAVHTSSSNDLQNTGLYATDEYYDVGGSGAQIIGTLSAGTSTAGAVTVTLVYMI